MTEKEEALALYHAYIGTISSNETRRHQLKSVYFTVTAALLALSGPSGLKPDLLAGLVCLISTPWALSMIYFRSLARAKFAVIEKLEQNFTVRPFDEEWRAMKSGNRLSLSAIDIAVPVTIIVAALAFLLYRKLC